MIELVFVIVLLGILAYIGSSFIPDNKLSNDTKFIIMKIRETQKDSIGYDMDGFGNSPWKKTDNMRCITIKKDTLNEIERDSKEEKKYHIISDIAVDGNETVCFDSFGRPYQGERLLLDIKEINITKGEKTRHLKLFPISGYVTIIK